MAFPDYSSVFSGGGTNFATQGFGGGLGNLSSGAGGGFSMDPITGGLLSLGGSIFGGLFGQSAANKALEAQVAGANFAAQLAQNQKSLEAAYGLMGPFLQEQFAPRQLERQKEAQRFQFGELGALQRAGREEDFRRAMSQQLSPEAKELRREQNRQALKQALAQQQGAMRGMFGPIAPINVDTMFTG
jgi:hypothetical protein